ncbi:MAG: type II toxin-antitoxin system ParD family antitoxin [Acidobacteriaceae bacterium]
MPTVQKISIALPPTMVDLLRDAVDRGEYASSSEVVREALRDWHHKRSLQKQGIRDLRKLWQEALADKSSGRPADEVLTRLEQKYQRQADDSR